MLKQQDQTIIVNFTIYPAHTQIIFFNQFFNVSASVETKQTIIFS